MKRHLILIMKLFLYCIIFSFSFATGNLDWTLSDQTVVFGNNIHLVCKLPNDTSCCFKYNRKWTAGVENKLIVMNGLSKNKKKYEEVLHERNRTSILTIKSFSEEDINIPYECAYAFLKNREILQLNKSIYEYHPMETLPVNPTFEKSNIKVNVTFRKVYPVPECFGTIGKTNLTSNVNVETTTNGIFYRSEITLNYTSSKEECRQTLLITCLIGKSKFEIVNSNIPCLYSGKQEVKLKIILAACLVPVFICIVALVMLFMIKRHRKHSKPDDKNESLEMINVSKDMVFNIVKGEKLLND